MKHALVLSFLILLSGKVFSQNYMDKIVEKSCSCAEAVPDSLETLKFNMQFGLCMFEAAMPYSKQIKKDHGIDLENIGTEGERFGRLIGLKMATVCPDILMKIGQRAQEKSGQSNKQTVEGTITKIEMEFFVVFTVKDNSGKIGKYYWLTHIKSDSDLSSMYDSLVGKTVVIDAESQEFFDPKIEEYRQFFVIKEFTVSP